MCVLVAILSLYVGIHHYSSNSLSISLSVCLSVYLSVCLSVCLSICLSARLSICLSVFCLLSRTGGILCRSLLTHSPLSQTFTLADFSFCRDTLSV